VQNAWRKLWKWAVKRRRQHKARSEQASTPWYKKKLAALAKSLWDNRYLLFKAEERMSEEEKQQLSRIVEADQQIGRLRSFLGGVWRIFEDSTDEQQARAALAALKQMPVDRINSKPFEQLISFLEENFEWMTAYLRRQGVKRNSLAESGMRVLRRLEIEHDGFQTPQGRENCLRIYQAVKYLVQLHRSLFAMHCPCNNRDYEPPHVCWSAVEHATTASGERPSLTRRLRVTTLPDPTCQRWRPTSLPDCGARRMYSTNRAQHDSCVQSRHDDRLASQIISP
jgi:Transposase